MAWMSEDFRFTAEAQRAQRKTQRSSSKEASQNLSAPRKQRQAWLAQCGLCLVLGMVVLAGCGSSKAPGSSYRVYVTNEASGDLTIIDPVKMEALPTVP